MGSSQPKKPSTLYATSMKLLLRKRIIGGILLCGILGVILWLTFEQGRTPIGDSSSAVERWLHAKILVDPETGDNPELQQNGVIVRPEGEEEEGLGGGPGHRGNKHRIKDPKRKNQSSRKHDADLPSSATHRKRKKGSRRGHLGSQEVDLGMSEEEAKEWIKQRVEREYCSPPEGNVTGEEGKFKPGYKLKAVYVVVRHGDRTPMTEFSNIPNSSWHPQWNCDFKEATKTLRSKLFDEFVDSVEKEVKSGLDLGRVPSHVRNIPIGNGRKCSKAGLTPVGWLQHMKLGQFLRSRYETTLVPNPNELANVSIFKSTVNTRTQQSAFSFMFGFLNGISLMDSTRIRTMPGVSFCPLDMCACPAVDHLVKFKEAEHAKLMRANPDFLRAMKNIAQTLYGTEMPSLLPGINAVAEILGSLVCHRMPYPCGAEGCLTPIQHAVYAKLITNNWLAQSHIAGGTYEKLGRLFIHPFLTDMVRNMYRVTHERSKKLFVFNSGHDITIRPMSDALQLSGPGWPSYAARIVFELWEKPGVKAGHFLRILAYGKDQTSQVRFCRDDLNEDGLCPLSSLLRFVETDNLEFFNAETYQEACTRNYWT